jgi:hypothetical protein
MGTIQKHLNAATFGVLDFRSDDERGRVHTGDARNAVRIEARRELSYEARAAARVSHARRSRPRTSADG